MKPFKLVGVYIKNIRVFLFIFILFQATFRRKICRPHQDSNYNGLSRRRACGPLDPHSHNASWSSSKSSKSWGRRYLSRRANYWGRIQFLVWRPQNKLQSRNEFSTIVGLEAEACSNVGFCLYYHSLLGSHRIDTEWFVIFGPSFLFASLPPCLLASLLPHSASHVDVGWCGLFALLSLTHTHSNSLSLTHVCKQARLL